MKISREEVLHVAELARLKFSNEEIDLFSRQLNDILVYIEKLNELDTEAVPATTHAHELKNRFRDDASSPSLPPEKALENAPEKDGSQFVVPRII